VAAGSAVLVGPGVATTLAPVDDRTRVAVGAVSLALSALSAGALFTAGEYATAYSARGCVDVQPRP
jgi:hypothetical protein